MAEGVADLAGAVATGRAGRLRLGLTGSTAFRLVPILLRHYRSAYPDVTIELVELPTVDQLDEINSGNLEAGLVRAPLLRDDLQSAPVWNEPFVAVLPANHALIERDTIAAGDLATEPFVMFPRERGPGLYDLIASMCEDAGFSPRVVQQAIQMQTIVGLVAAGFGVSVVPASVQDFRLHGIVYRPLKEPAPISTIALVWNDGVPSSTRDRFIELALGQHLASGTASGS
jgi:DNA-binding transcriptional LysR family regulator